MALLYEFWHVLLYVLDELVRGTFTEQRDGAAPRNSYYSSLGLRVSMNHNLYIEIYVNPHVFTRV